MSVRKTHTASFKAKVALTRDKTMSELCSEYGVLQTQINKWKREIKEGAVGVFNGEGKSEEAVIQKKLHELHAKIGQHSTRHRKNWIAALVRHWFCFSWPRCYW